MVADRRLTFEDGRLAEDNRNKLVLCESNIVFGYTGLARLGGTYTDEWLMDRLSRLTQKRLDDKLMMLAHEVRDTVRKCRNVPRMRRFLAILGIGFARESGQRELRPLFCLISNCHQENWRPASSAFDGVRLLSRPLGPSRSVEYESVGQRMSTDDERLLRRRMRRLHEKSRLDGQTMIPILAEAIRSVARRNERVGKNLLAVAIPRKSVRPGRLLLTAGTGDEGHPTFLYLPAGTSSPEHYAPAITASGVQIKDSRYGPANRDGSVSLRR
jgi:hypothetical protein